MDIEAFQPLDQYFERMDRLVAQLRSVPAAAGYEAIYYPGEPEERSERKRLAEGLDLPRDTMRELCDLATACKVPGDLLDGQIAPTLGAPTR